MITKEQYEAAKKIVDEYEQQEYADIMREAEDYNDDDDDDDEHDPLESEWEACTCGAYQLSKSGKIIKLSDCCC